MKLIKCLSIFERKNATLIDLEEKLKGDKEKSKVLFYEVNKERMNIFEEKERLDASIDDIK